MAERANEFSWSFSRARAFETCPRAYYYQYYGSWCGWRDHAPADARQLYFLKKLETLPAWAGQIVHRLIQEAIDQGEQGSAPAAGDLRRRAARMLKEGWARSLDNLGHRRQKHFRLAEHYYANVHGEPPPDAAARVLQDRVNTCLENFCAADLLPRFQQLRPADWVVRQCGDEGRFPSFLLEGVRVWAILDLAVREATETVIYDWKSGRPWAKDQLQLACYALYLQNEKKILATAIATVPVYLQRPGPWEPEGITQQRIDDTLGYVRRSVEGMREPLQDAGRNLALIDDFPTNPHPHICRCCNYREVCEAWPQVRGAEAADAEDTWPEDDMS